MENKTIHYDGSVQMNDENTNNSVVSTNEPFEISDEIRKNISGNPFVIE
ncbi:MULTISPECIES: hypothetical protein [Neobacillus]|uniref:Uncharacterized protein n=1 Tax=Neobacillus rhizosphaerae TaxID=2880965 RepID=A0ABN8KRQ8_9BACI|nr:MULTISPECIES: hypothetical protein [Neobacillus]CAH2715160.1 hypothetical protein BACCIP111895_02344 [Neobacillus rhizosphaerae]